MRRPLALLLFAAWAALLPATALAGQIEGTVRPIGSAPEIEVCVAGVSPPENCAVPAADGTYRMTLAEGPYKIVFLPTFRLQLAPQYYDHKDTLVQATSINVPREGTLEGIDADMKAGGVIKGKVTAQGEAADLAEVEVCAKSTSSPPARSCSETDAQGEYELHSLGAGTYKVGFWGHGASAGYQPQYYSGASGFAQGTPISVAVGEQVTGIDVGLAPGSEIGGTLHSASSGATLADISVCMFAAGGAGPERCTYSSDDGTYRFQGLSSGSYQVGFSLGSAEIGGEAASGEEDGFLSQYFAGVASRNEAQTISLVAPTARSGVDANLQTPPATPPTVPLIVPPALVPAPPAIAVPPTKQGCKKGYRRQKVKGRTRCFKVHRKKHGKKHRGSGKTR